jgi:hypothetical protein
MSTPPNRAKRTLLGGIVKRNRLCVVRSSFGEVTYMQQRRSHKAMTHYERHRRLLLLGERQELLGRIATDISVEDHVIRDPEAVENRE